MIIMPNCVINHYNCLIASGDLPKVRHGQQRLHHPGGPAPAGMLISTSKLVKSYRSSLVITHGVSRETFRIL